METRSFLPLLFAAGSLVAAGCSTIVNLGRPPGLDVKSDPPGASIFVDGVPMGQTPARIKIDGGSGEHVVRLEKTGCPEVEQTVRKRMDPWVWGNAPFAVFGIVAAAGVGVDACCGRWYRIEPSELNFDMAARKPSDGKTASAKPEAVLPDRKRARPAVVEAPQEPVPAQDSDNVIDELLKQVLDNN